MQKFNIIEKIKCFFTKFYKTNKKLFMVVVVLVVMVFCGLISMFSSKSNKSNSAIQNSSNASVDGYAELIEGKIENILSSLSVVDDVDAFVMLESSVITNYLIEKEQTITTNGSSTTESLSETVVLEKDGSSQSPVIVSTTLPKILGVLIYVNKIDSSTKVAIINALSVVLNVDESCISILQDR